MNQDNSNNNQSIHFDIDSGVQQHLGFNIEILVGEGSRISLDVNPTHLNRQGQVHGGIISLLLDVSMGYACSGKISNDAKVPFTTLSMSTNFLSPATTGQLIATGKVIGGGYKILFADAQLSTPDGTLIATSNGTMKRAG
ncbi:MAG: PaaI family thioesterase [Gammaproteobacteria bacterium]|nr:MAG: PaaI family thioesterase [Gammaproteobacteria bacterium]